MRVERKVGKLRCALEARGVRVSRMRSVPGWGWIWSWRIGMGRKFGVRFVSDTVAVISSRMAAGSFRRALINVLASGGGTRVS